LSSLPGDVTGWALCSVPNANAQAAEPLPYPPGWPDELPRDPRAQIPDLATAPLGKCRTCRFTAPLNAAGLCGRCAHQRLVELARRGAA
jgi:hypothetical protein